MPGTKKSGGKVLPWSQTTKAFHKLVSVHYTPWGEHAQAWPRPRGKNGTPAQLEAREMFRKLAAAIREIPDIDKLGARVLAEDTSYTWRDILSRMLFGRLIEIEGWTNVTTSTVLDAITDVEGSIFYRGPDGWIGLEPGVDGKTLHLIAGLPAWDDVTVTLTGDVTGTGPSDAVVTTLAPTGATAGTYLHPAIYIGADGRIISVTELPPTQYINQLTGDVSAGPGVGSQAATLAATGVTSGTYTNATITVDAKGRLLSASTGTTPGGVTQLTGDVTAGPGTGSQAATLAASGVTPGSYTLANLTVDAKGRITAASNGTASGGLNQLTGDVLAGPGTGSQAATLAASGVTAGSYTAANLTIDAKGRVTSASNGSGFSGPGNGLYAGELSAIPSSSGTGFTTWGNQASAHFTNAPAGLVVQGAQSSNNISGLIKSAPAGNYNAYGLFEQMSLDTAAFGLIFGWYDGTKLHGLAMYNNAGSFTLYVLAYGSLTTGASATRVDKTVTNILGRQLWLQLRRPGDGNAYWDLLPAGSQTDRLNLFTLADASKYLANYNNIFFGIARHGAAMTGAMLSYGEN